MRKSAFSTVFLAGISAAFLFLTSGAFAEDRLVPSEYSTIQAAIDDCNNGDVVIVEPNVYTGTGNRDLDFGGKAITVRSTDPNDPAVVAATVINCEGSDSDKHRGFRFHNGEGADSVVAGLTITNGYGPEINISGYGPPQSVGGGIFCQNNSSPTISKCLIYNNRARQGGGICCYASSPTISHCIIRNNSTFNFGVGGGIRCFESNITVEHCAITNNSCTAVGGFSCSRDSHSAISHSIVWGNGAREVKVSTSDDDDNSYLTVSYSDIEGGEGGVGVGRLATLIWGAGNIESDPIFADPVNDDYHLYGTSPCIDAGDPCYSASPGETDIDGDTRVVNGRIDIGADEYNIEETIIEVLASEFDFSATLCNPQPNNQVLYISNGSGGTLEWEITESCSWLEAAPANGISTGDVNEVILSVDSTGLDPGSYYCELVITAEGATNSPQIVQVNLVIYEPLIGLSKTEFIFLAMEDGNNPNGQILGVSNGGECTLNWTAVEDCDWLQVDPNSGSSTGEPNEVILSVDASGFQPGEYNCELVIIADEASNSPQTVEVALNIYADVNGILYVPLQYPTIQAGIDAAVNGDIVIVAPGTYTGAGNRDLDFGGKAITVRGTDPEDPNVVAATVIDCENVNGHRSFYFHSGEEPNSVVSGFTIKRGRVSSGGGIYCSGSSPTIENCIITNNKAYGSDGYTPSGNGGSAYGGGIYCRTGSSPVVINCTISSNTTDAGNGGDAYYSPSSGCHPAGNGGSAYGGGIYCSADSNMTIDNCVITNNTCDGGYAGFNICGPAKNDGSAYGGAVYGEVTINNSTISNNLARGGSPFGLNSVVDGGGIYGLNSSSIVNCLIIENEAQNFRDAYGGGIYGSDITIINSTIYNNVADSFWAGETGGIHCTGTATIRNCIIWGNGDDLYGCSATYSCIEDGDAGTGNISADPCFATGPKGDHYLSQVAAGQASDSPCVDAGSDMAANLAMDIFTTRTDKAWDEGVVDIGYHYSGNIGDLDDDGDVELVDFAILGSQWEQSPGTPSADIAQPKGLVDINDLALLLDNWLWKQ